MTKAIYKSLDKLVPRGGKKPNNIHVSLETYLSRLANFNRKLIGTKYRIEKWNSTVSEHKIKFDQNSDFLKKYKFPKNIKITNYSFSLQDTKIENEFESLLYSISSALTALTRIIACFLNGATDFHSHSRLSNTLKKYDELNAIYLIVDKANNLWASEMTARRDAAMHYIALFITSSFQKSKSGKINRKNKIVRIGIPITPQKNVSLWDDVIPVIGGFTHTSIITNDSDVTTESHQLVDSKKKIIIQINSPLPKKPEQIDGEKYVKDLYKNFNRYINLVLTSLRKQL